MPDDDLVRVLTAIQRRGAIGQGSIVDAITHAEQFVAVVPAEARHLIDLGSGGGLPGLVIAVRLPDLHVLMVERRRKRVDLLRYGIAALGLTARAEVWPDDVEALVATQPDPVDVVTARSFGPLAEVLRVAYPLLRPGGICVVSTPPGGVTAAPSDHYADGGQLGAVHRWTRR